MAELKFEKYRQAHLPPTVFPRLEYEEEKCTRCKLCVQTCPTSCLQWDEAGNRPIATGFKGLELACIACNNCEALCPAGCIRMRGEYRVLSGRYKTPADRQGEMIPPRPFGETDAGRSFDQIQQELTETEQVIYNRRSIRLFKDKPVPRELIHRIIEAARFAPSAGNGQPVKFIVVTDRALNEKIDKKCARVLNLIKHSYAGGGRWSKLLVTLMSYLMVNKWDQRPIAAMEKVRMLGDSITFKAPVVIHVLMDHRGISHPDLDAAIAAHNLVLAAHALGLGTCYIGFIASTIQYAPSVKKLLGITYPYKLATSISLGYPKTKRLNPVARGPVPVEWIGP